MIIESIKTGKNDKEKLVIRTTDGEYIFAYIDDAYKLRRGDEISAEKAAELTAGYEAYSAKKSAARSLAKRSMSKAELSKKLRDKGFSEEQSEDTAGWFEERGFVNDEDYANSCVEYYRNRGYGAIRIREELRRRGISKEIAEELIENLPTGVGEIQKLIEKKVNGQGLDAEKKRKLVAFLLRRGFKYDEIRNAMSEMHFDTEDMI